MWILDKKAITSDKSLTKAQREALLKVLKAGPNQLLKLVSSRPRHPAPTRTHPAAALSRGASGLSPRISRWRRLADAVRACVLSVCTRRLGGPGGPSVLAQQRTVPDVHTCPRSHHRNTLRW